MRLDLYAFWRLVEDFFPLLITKEVKWSTSVAHSFTQKEQQQTKNTKACRKESSLDIILMALCWNEMVAFRVVGQDFNSKSVNLH